MPSISSLFSNGPKAGSPCLIFQGPDKQGHIRAINNQNQDLAHFIASKNSVVRLRGPSQQQICTFKRSSLLGTITLRLHGQKIKIKQSWEGMQYGKDIDSPVGKLKWRAGSSGCEELRDKRKTLLARGRLPGTFRSKPSDLEVFVSGDEFLLDLVLSSWISMVRGTKDEADEIQAMAEIVGAAGGAAGGAA